MSSKPIATLRPVLASRAILERHKREPITLLVTLHPSGALSCEGPIHEKNFCIAMLENAKDSVRNHRGPGELVIPGKDVSVT